MNDADLAAWYGRAEQFQKLITWAVVISALVLLGSSSG